MHRGTPTPQASGDQSPPPAPGGPDWSRGPVASAIALVLLIAAAALLPFAMRLGHGQSAAIQIATPPSAPSDTIAAAPPPAPPAILAPAFAPAFAPTSALVLATAEPSPFAPNLVPHALLVDLAADNAFAPPAQIPGHRPAPDAHADAAHGEVQPPASPSAAPRLAQPEPEPEPAPIAGSAGLLIDLNTAGAAELQLLPGIGPAMSARIIEDRAANGPFPSLEALDRVRGIGPRTVENLRGKATVSGVPADTGQPKPGSNAGPNAAPAKIPINTATAEELETLPGIGPALAARIIEDRRTNGPFHTVDDLQRVRGIGPRTIERLRPLITARIPATRP